MTPGFYNLDLAAKIRWRMKYDRNPLLTRLQDKLAVKKYAAEMGVPSAKVLFETQNPATIPFDELPEKCFIKANHGRNWNILKYQGRFFDFKDGDKLVSNEGCYQLNSPGLNELSIAEVIKNCSNWLETKYRPVEWAYLHIPPAIFVENIIEPEPGKETMDYRIYTFGGKVAAISIGSPSMRKKDENIFFDTAWNKIVLKNNFEKEPEIIPEKPPFLSEMVEAAGKLGKKVDFVRIDFFADSRRFYLSEITIYPNGGQDNRPTSDHEFNQFLGRQWKMNPWQILQAYWLEAGHRLSKTLQKAK
jgi:hypothetical protein